MRAVAVDETNRGAFLDYCRRWGTDHDESFIPDAEKAPHGDYPAYLLQEDGMPAAGPAGAACLVRTPPFTQDRKGRLMIWHTESRSAAGYAALLEGLRPHFAGLGRIYGFLPETYGEVRRIWEGLGFTIERFSYLLCYKKAETPPVVLPPGFRFVPVDRGDPALMAAAVDLDNLNFAGQPGHVEYSVARLEEDLTRSEFIEGGLMLLQHGDRLVGTVWVTLDEETGGSFVSMLTVHPDYRGRGLGHAIVRQAVGFSRQHGLHDVYLSVSAENETAAHLYLSEGFETEKVLVCYQLFT